MWKWKSLGDILRTCAWQINKEKRKEAQPLHSPLRTLIHNVCILKDSYCIRTKLNPLFYYSFTPDHQWTRPLTGITKTVFPHIHPQSFSAFFPSASCMWRSRITGSTVVCSTWDDDPASLFSAGGVRDSGWYLPRYYHYQSTLSVRWGLSAFPHMKH